MLPSDLWDARVDPAEERGRVLGWIVAVLVALMVAAALAAAALLPT